MAAEVQVENIRPAGPEITIINNIWEIFVKIPNVQKATCTICGTSIGTANSGTSSLHSHAKRHNYEAPKKESTKKRKNGKNK